MAASPEAARRDAEAVAARLREDGFRAYLNGGCVRDLLLGKTPKDYDIATDARPEQVQAIFPKTVAVGAQFGVVVVVAGSSQVEVATFRSDEGYVDGRRPTAVYFGEHEQDALRRDFTINGLFRDPATGEILDFVGGRKDLAARTIRAIGDPAARFREDKLRLLRAVRFAAQLGFAIEPATLEAMRALAPEIRVVSAERVLVELTKTLTAAGRVRGLELLMETGLLAAVLPEVAALAGVAQPPEYHPEGDCWVHTCLVVANASLAPPDGPPPEELAFAALLHDVGKPPTFRVAADRIRFDNHAAVGAGMTDEILRRLKAPNRLREVVVELVADHLKFIDVPRMKESTLKRFLRNEAIDLHLALHRADCLGSHRQLGTYELCLRRLEELRREGGAEALRPKPLLSGHDLIAMGYEPGPLFKEILTALEDAQLEGRVASADDARAFVRERFPTPPAEPPPAPPVA